MSKGLIIGLVAENENGALKAATDNMSYVFSTLEGYTHKTIDLLSPDGLAELATVLKSESVDFAYGFAGVGSRLEARNGLSLWEEARTPFVSLWYDHPSYNYAQHSFSNPYVLHGYHMADHYAVRQKILVPEGDQTAFLLPQFIACNPYSRSSPWEKREEKLFYVKSGQAPEAWAKDWDRHPPKLREILWELAETSAKDRTINLLDRASALFDAAQMDKSNLDVFMGVIQEVDAYVRAWRSDKMARALLSHDAVIIGSGWDYLKDQKGRASFLSPLPAHQLPKQIASRRLVANTNPLWADGLHERTSLGVSSGCVTLTDRTPLADHYFSKFPHFLSFDWGDDLQDVLGEAFHKAQTLPSQVQSSWDLTQELQATTLNRWKTILFEKVEEVRSRARL